MELSHSVYIRSLLVWNIYAASVFHTGDWYKLFGFFFGFFARLFCVWHNILDSILHHNSKTFNHASWVPSPKRLVDVKGYDSLTSTNKCGRKVLAIFLFSNQEVESTGITNYLRQPVWWEDQSINQSINQSPVQPPLADNKLRVLTYPSMNEQICVWMWKLAIIWENEISILP